MGESGLGELLEKIGQMTHQILLLQQQVYYYRTNYTRLLQQHAALEQ